MCRSCRLIARVLPSIDGKYRVLLLHALGVVVVLSLASTAGAACRTGPVPSTTLSPDGSALFRKKSADVLSCKVGGSRTLAEGWLEVEAGGRVDVVNVVPGGAEVVGGELLSPPPAPLQEN